MVYILGIMYLVTLTSDGFAMSLQQRSHLEMERIEICQAAKDCKILETVESLNKLAKFHKEGSAERDLVSVMKDAVDNVKQSLEAIDEKCASWKGSRSVLLPLSCQKAFILRNLSDLYTEIKNAFKAIHTAEADEVRRELRALGFTDV